MQTDSEIFHKGIGLILLLAVVGTGVTALVSWAHSEPLEAEKFEYQTPKRAIAKWKCGFPPVVPPKEIDYDTKKEWHLAVSAWKAKTYAWNDCSTQFTYKFDRAIRKWSQEQIEAHPVERITP